MRSLYDSSSSVSIQPLSRFSARSERKCRSIPATMPGTPAIDSRKMNRTSCVRCRQPTTIEEGMEQEGRTHCRSVRGLSATTAVVGRVLSVFCSLLSPVALSMKNLDVRIRAHAILSPHVTGSLWPGTTASISASV